MTNTNNKAKDFILLPLSVIEKMQKEFEVFYLKEHDKWLKVQEIGEKAITRVPVQHKGVPCYKVTSEEFKILNELLDQASQII